MSLTTTLQLPADDAAAFAAARSLCRAGAPAFHLASMLLPMEKRNAVHAVGAVCHRLLSAGAEAASPAEAEQRIAAIEQRLNAIYLGGLKAGDGPDDLVFRALERTIRQHAIPRHYFADLIEGCRMDLHTQRYGSWTQLQNHCHLTGGIIGLILCRIAGQQKSAVREQADQLGMALRFTRLLCNIASDLKRDRIYLPQEDMARFGLVEADLARGDAGARFRQLMRFEIDRARALYRQGALGLCQLPQGGGRLAASALAVGHSAILRTIEQRNYDVFTAPIRLRLLQKTACLRHTWRLSRRQADHPLPGVF